MDVQISQKFVNAHVIPNQERMNGVCVVNAIDVHFIKREVVLELHPVDVVANTKFAVIFQAIQLCLRLDLFARRRMRRNLRVPLPLVISLTISSGGAVNLKGK